MITNESQVRLTVDIRGRLASTGANSNTKKEHKLAAILTRKGKQFHNEYVEPTYHNCTEGVTLSSECVRYFISDDGKPSRITPSEWKRMSKIKRLEANLQVQADALSGHSNTVFTYAIID